MDIYSLLIGMVFGMLLSITSRWVGKRIVKIASSRLPKEGQKPN